MNYVVYHIESLRIHKSTDNEASAKRMVTVLNKKTRQRARTENQPIVFTSWAYATREAYNAMDTEVETYNMLDPQRRPIKIRKSLKGGCCDPATETYHSM